MLLCYELILIINPLYPSGYTSQHFVRNRIQFIRKDSNRKIITEDNRLVTLTAVDVRYINHTNIHTDIADIRRFFSIHQTVSGSEWIIIALVILLLFGGKKIPELMRGLGKGVKSFKDGVNEAKDEINKAKDELDKPVDPSKN